MATFRAVSNVICVVHFDGKDGEIKKLTEGTFAKIIDMRKQWLNFSSSFDRIREKIFQVYRRVRRVDRACTRNLWLYTISTAIEFLPT